MHILFTGNMGYVGPAVVRHFRQRFPESRLVGYDAGFFAHCLTSSTRLPETYLDEQHFGDIRDFPADLVGGVDAVVHLAAVSNDPMGSEFEQATASINQDASLRLAKLSQQAGVSSFVFASSCSVYGFAEGGVRKETDCLNPLTAYARSKIGTENALSGMANGRMTVTSLRFATACGMSDRLRLDLVLNDFVAAALTSGEVQVLSDGTPWRPLIDVADMARAFEWAVQRPRENGGTYLAVNAGSDSWNYQVKDLAHAVAAAILGSRVSINMNAQPDKRSYRVDFSRYAALAPEHQPQVKLSDSIRNLVRGLTDIGFRDSRFRESQLVRLKVLRSYVAGSYLSPDLRWQG